MSNEKNLRAITRQALWNGCENTVPSLVKLDVNGCFLFDFVKSIEMGHLSGPSHIHYPDPVVWRHAGCDLCILTGNKPH